LIKVKGNYNWEKLNCITKNLKIPYQYREIVKKNISFRYEISDHVYLKTKSVKHRMDLVSLKVNMNFDVKSDRFI